MPDGAENATISASFSGGPEGTSSWARVLADGRLELEFYDHSSISEQFFGNDVAFLYRVDAGEKLRLYELLTVRCSRKVAGDESMLAALVEAFRDAMQVKSWLEANQIPFQKEFDSWA